MHTMTRPAESLDANTTPRLDFARVAPEAFQAQFGFERYVRSSGLEPSLLHLLKVRASILNGCAYCVDMHTKDARHEGETEQRLYGVSVWRETPYFTPRERAALAWTDALTLLPAGAPSDALYEQVREHFDEKGIVDLTMAVNAINGWNRLAVGFRAPVGTYRVGGRG